MSKNDGGPAFPQINRWDNQTLSMGSSGMTVRQYYKAAALASFATTDMLLAIAQTSASHGIDSAKGVAKMCGAIADAMIAEDKDES